MKKIICDRCGKEIKYYPMMLANLPIIKITKIYSPLEELSIDLCENCKIEFLSWLDELSIKQDRRMDKDGEMEDIE